MALVNSGATYRLINVKSGTVLDLSGTDRIHHMPIVYGAV